MSPNDASDLKNSGHTQPFEIVTPDTQPHARGLVIKKNPEGILRSLGRFKDDPELEELGKAMQELRELDQESVEKAA